MTERQVRTALKRIGRRREKLAESQDQLRADTVEGLNMAKGVISTSEAARLVGLNRSTVYEVYRKKD